jgi:hypothetical protein
MDKDALIHLLETNGERFAALVAGLSEEQARWKPDPDSWSVLEIVNHMLDEERLDFRLRLDTVLYHPGEELQPNDPTRWPEEHDYLARSLNESIQDFLAERRRSLEWLAGLHAPDWEVTRTMPWGKMPAGEFFVSWPAHDVLHMRQIVSVLWALTNHLSQPYPTLYAGEW